MPNTITVWENDPGSGITTTALKPNLQTPTFSLLIPGVAPAPSSITSSDAFRYWTAAEALRRGTDFWKGSVQSGKWHRGDELDVNLDIVGDLQADYDRQALNFYFGPAGGQTVFAAASSDMICHELGHAILDAVKPELWNSSFHEIAAFHESFGDMSAILCALQVPSFRDAILVETNFRLSRNSRLSRIAEQFGSALHLIDPTVADADCLRNAANSFCYCNPLTLPSLPAAAQLSSYPHSFSRIFTGALFQALDGMLASHAANPAAPTSDELLKVSTDMRDIMIGGVVNAAVVPNYFAEVAHRMVQQSSPKYSAIFEAAFVSRAILAVQTVAAMQPAATANETDDTHQPPGDFTPAAISLPATRFGFADTLLVEAASAAPRFIARGAGPDNHPVEPLAPEEAAAAFVSELFTNGQIGSPNGHGFALPAQANARTHEVIEGQDGFMLRRLRFTCGSCCRRP